MKVDHKRLVPGMVVDWVSTHEMDYSTPDVLMVIAVYDDRESGYKRMTCWQFVNDDGINTGLQDIVLLSGDEFEVLFGP